MFCACCVLKLVTDGHKTKRMDATRAMRLACLSTWKQNISWWSEATLVRLITTAFGTGKMYSWCILWNVTLQQTLQFTDTLRKLRKVIQNKQCGMLNKFCYCFFNAHPHNDACTHGLLDSFKEQLFNHPLYSPNMASHEKIARSHSS